MRTRVDSERDVLDHASVAAAAAWPLDPVTDPEGSVGVNERTRDEVGEGVLKRESDRERRGRRDRRDRGKKPGEAGGPERDRERDEEEQELQEPLDRLFLVGIEATPVERSAEQRNDDRPAERVGHDEGDHERDRRAKQLRRPGLQAEIAQRPTDRPDPLDGDVAGRVPVGPGAP